MNQKHKNVITTVIIATVSACLLYAFKKYRKNIIRTIQNVNNPLKNQQIEIVNNFEQWRNVVDKIKIDCNEYNVLGFDCEWLTVGGSRRPIALLQLATHKGLCALIRLCHLKRIPPELREILEDNNIIKVGVAPHDDATYLAKDYGVCVASTLDLRYVAQLTGFKQGGLAKLSSTLLNVELDKDWRIRCSDWEAPTLNDKQIEYAAKDAHVAIEVFKVMEGSYGNENSKWFQRKPQLGKFLSECDVFLDIKFKTASVNPAKAARKNARQFSTCSNKPYVRSISTRSKPLYDNCYLEAPDGEMLCTCDRKKAQWYVYKDLGRCVNGEPFTVRLNFEPSGRAVGEVGQYYLQEKKNQCVVCGKTDAYIRKNVVPREYRKYFPDVMKNHSSHDIVLLCVQCHQTSNMSDLPVRYKLEKLCNAPIKDNQIKHVEIPNMKKLHSAARALLNSNNNIPEERKEELRKVILEEYPDEELSDEFLQCLIQLPSHEKLENYVSHGEKVVDYYTNKNGGLVEFEKMWRQHFLNTMKPKFLPPLWSVTHNSERLEIRAEEGRVQIEDMLSAGLDPSLVKPSISNSLDKSNSENNNLSQSNTTITSITCHSNDDEISTNDENFNKDNFSLGTPLTLSNYSMLGSNCEYDSDDLDSLLSQPRSNSGNITDEFEE